MSDQEILDLKDDIVRWKRRAVAAIQRIVDAEYDEAIEILQKEADEYVDFVYCETLPLESGLE